MKTKTYLRYISCVLAVLLCVASIMPIAFADSTNHGNSESLLTGSNYSVSYSMNGKDVVEQLTIRDGGITRITRTVHPNDVMDIVVVGASGESTTSTARSDYSLFYEIYQDQQNYKNGQLAQIPALTGSEVTGSQFKHRYVGTSATDTVYASDLRKCKKASDVASILATAWGSTPAAVISSTASFIFDQMLQSMSSDCYKVTIFGLKRIIIRPLVADSDFKEQGEHVMGFFKQKGPLQRDFCEVLLYVVALWALKPASLQDILTVNQCDGMWFFSAAFFAIVFVGIVSDYLLITNHFVAWKAIHGNVNQTTFQELQKFALCENQKVAIEPKLASCILVVLAGCLTAAFVWFTFICR